MRLFRERPKQPENSNQVEPEILDIVSVYGFGCAGCPSGEKVTVPHSVQGRGVHMNWRSMDWTSLTPMPVSLEVRIGQGVLSRMESGGETIPCNGVNPEHVVLGCQFVEAIRQAVCTVKTSSAVLSAQTGIFEQNTGAAGLENNP